MPDISATLVSNSTQLDNVDLMGGPRVFTITGVTLGDGDQPLSIALAEYGRPWKPGLTMRRLLSEMWGVESDSWIGRRVRLYRDDTVTFGREKPGGTRISHASHLDKTVVVTLPISKGKFAEFRVEPLPESAPTKDDGSKARSAKAAAHFASKFDVTQQQLETRVGRPMAEWTTADLDGLMTVSSELLAGSTTVGDAFPVGADASDNDQWNEASA